MTRSTSAEPLQRLIMFRVFAEVLIGDDPDADSRQMSNEAVSDVVVSVLRADIATRPEEVRQHVIVMLHATNTVGFETPAHKRYTWSGTVGSSTVMYPVSLQFTVEFSATRNLDGHTHEGLVKFTAGDCSFVQIYDLRGRVPLRVFSDQDDMVSRPTLDLYLQR
jgi:hypothetical protein